MMIYYKHISLVCVQSRYIHISSDASPWSWLGQKYHLKKIKQNCWKWLSWSMHLETFHVMIHDFWLDSSVSFTLCTRSLNLKTNCFTHLLWLRFIFIFYLLLSFFIKFSAFTQSHCSDASFQLVVGKKTSESYAHLSEKNEYEYMNGYGQWFRIYFFSFCFSFLDFHLAHHERWLILVHSFN